MVTCQQQAGKSLLVLAYFICDRKLISKFEKKIAREKLRRFQIICEICSLNEHTIEKD